MTLDEFRQKYDNQLVDFDGYYGAQCMDLVELYNRDVIGSPRLGGNAKDLVKNTQPDFYEYHSNTPFYIPRRGSIAIWNANVGGGFGHVAIVLEANLFNFRSFDQNWPTGAPCQMVNHNYRNVEGFLFPINRDIMNKYNDLIDEMRKVINKYPKV